MSVEYVDLADFIAIAAAVTGLNEDTITKVAPRTFGAIRR